MHRPRSWSSAASIWARHLARSSAGDGWPRSTRCSSGGERVYPEDIQDLARYVLSHRIWLGPHAASHGLTTDMVIEDVLWGGWRFHEEAGDGGRRS